jgi:hypothetical protein
MSSQKPNEINITPLAFELIWTAMMSSACFVMRDWKDVDTLFIKIFQNTPQLCWGDEWPTLSPGGEGEGEMI